MCSEILGCDLSKKIILSHVRPNIHISGEHTVHEFHQWPNLSAHVEQHTFILVFVGYLSFIFDALNSAETMVQMCCKYIYQHHIEINRCMQIG